MGRQKIAVPMLAAVALASFVLVATNIEAAPPKGSKSAAHMNVKDNKNTDAQWKADPEKGWVRADERRQLHKERKEDAKPKQGNRKGNSPKKNS
jgi:hypothetical protein